MRELPHQGGVLSSVMMRNSVYIIDTYSGHCLPLFGQKAAKDLCQRQSVELSLTECLWPRYVMFCTFLCLEYISY